ncbi:MAG: nitroreductase family protein [Clostridia bacterium]|nr:nitroreductase family protein [Clostridia bacterium]
MDLLKLFEERYSERNFSDKKIEKEKLDKILEAGRIAPTAHNYQPQRFFVIKSEEGLQKAKNVTPKPLDAPVIILFCYDKDTVWVNDRETVFVDFNAGEQDCSIAGTQMMYMAEEMGIHTLWIRGYDSQKIYDNFDLPENMVPVFMIAFGYPSDTSKPSPRHFMRYDIENFVKEI